MSKHPLQKQEDLSQEISERIRMLRNCSGYTQEYVGHYLHITRQAYSFYECCQRTPSLEDLHALSKLYRIPEEFLLPANPVSEEIIRKSYASQELYLIRLHLRRLPAEDRRKLIRILAAELPD